MRKRDMAMYGVALVLAFVVGILVGGQCNTSAPLDPPPPTTVAAVCDPVREVVYQCPPDAGTTETVHASGEAPPAVTPKKALPKAEPPISPRQRKRLLAWVRDQSVDLEGCRSAAKDTYRLSVTLQLDEDGAVSGVRLNAPASELPSNVGACLRDRMRQWTPPSTLVKDRRELVFGLTL